MSCGDAYPAQLRDLKASGTSLAEVVTTLTTDDVRDGCDLFANLCTSTEGVDGLASIEVDPRMARDTQPTIERAQSLSDLVDCPKLLVKVPATSEGLPAITATIAAGISINSRQALKLARVRSGLDGAARTGRLACRD